MSFYNQEYTEHIYWHDVKPHKNCEWCAMRSENIVKNWFQKHWISAKEYARLLGLPF